MESAWAASREATAREALGDVLQGDGQVEWDKYKVGEVIARLLAMLPKPAPAKPVPPEPKFKRDDRVIFDLFGGDVVGYVDDPMPDGEYGLIEIRRDDIIYCRRQSEVHLAPEPMTFGQWMAKEYPYMAAGSQRWRDLRNGWQAATEQARRED